MIAVNDGKIVKVGDERAARPLRRAPGRDRQHLHVRAPRLDPEQVPGAQAGQGHRQRRSPRSSSAPAAPAPTRRRPAPAAAGQRRRRQRAKAAQRAPRAPPITLAGHAASRASSRSRSRQARRQQRRQLGRRAAGQGAAVRQSVAARAPTPPAAACSSRTRRRRSRASRTTSPTSCTWPRTSTRSQPLKAGAIVVAGTILGRIGAALADRRLAPGVHDPARPARTRRRSTPSRSSTAGSCSRRPPSTAPPASTRSSAPAPRTRRSARSC